MATKTEQLALIARLLGRTTVVLMRDDFAIDHARERYFVEVDGKTKAEYRIFVKALTAGLQLKQENPSSRVKVREAIENTSVH